MKKKLIFIAKYFLFWWLYFLFIKTFFIIFNAGYLKGLPLSELPLIYWYGMRLDISAATYVLTIPFLLLLIDQWVTITVLPKLIKVYTFILLAIFSFLVVVDAELYSYWGFRLDLTPLQYINTPGAMMASVTGWIIARQLMLAVLITGLFVWLFNRMFPMESLKTAKVKIPSFLVLLILFCSLIIPIRGGIGLAPLNTGSAYFSSNNFANHAAINVIWNVGFAAMQTETRSNPYRVMDPDRAEQIIVPYLNNNPNDPTIQLIHYNRPPNVLLIVLESFMAKLLPAAGGDTSIVATPRLNALVKEGVFFPQVYSTGTRSDKGLISIINGFPAFPNVLVMRYPDKTEKLPAIAKDLRNIGYSTAYYYGGDIDFVSMRSFAKNAGFSTIVSMTDFPASTYNAKWGVHDHIVFKRLLNDLDTARSPFFYTFFTLSSHEPFDVPMKTVIQGNDDDHKFLNSVYYTDSCLGDFIEKAKRKDWWKNTLVILIADHGVLRLGVHDAYDPARFHIPMLWIGGVVKRDTIIPAVVSQTDVPATLFGQLGMSSKQYPYSRNVLVKHYSGVAVGAFNSGIVVFSKNGIVAYDYTDQKIKFEQGEALESLLEFGKAYLQKSYDDFLHLNSR